MRYSNEHKIETRNRVLNAAGEIFRQEGYGGSGIDALTKAAGVTNGAFYGHFKSKGEAFKAAMQAGLEELRFGISNLKAQKGRAWLAAFVSYYLGPKLTCALGQSCALPSLSPDVMRADADTRVAYEVELRRLIEEVASGLAGSSDAAREEDAIAILAMLSGGVTMARAVSDPALSKCITDALERKVGAIASSMEER